MKRRIGVELDDDLIDRLDRQAAMLEVPRSEVIDTACRNLLREWEQIDRECGLPRGAGR